MSRAQIAREVGVTPGTITRWCRDQGAPPRPSYLRDWARLCEVPYEWLLTGEGSVNEPLRTPARDKHDRAADRAFDRWEEAEPTDRRRQVTDGGVSGTSQPNGRV